MKHFLLISVMTAILIGCTSPQPANKSIREHLCEQEPEGPKVRQSGEAEMGINSKGEIIRSVSINFESTSLFGGSNRVPSKSSPGACN